MKLFKNRVFAVFLAVLVVIASTLINTDVKFGRKCSEVTGQFYADLTRSGSPDSISGQLVNILSDSESLSTLAARYGADTKALDEANSQLSSRLTGKLGASYVYVSYNKLCSALTSLMGQLANSPLSEQDSAEVTRCADSIAEAQNLITMSDYNSVVRSFLHRYDRFPTNLLAKLAGVDMPETFS